MFAIDHFQPGRLQTRFSPFYLAFLVLMLGVTLLAPVGSAAALSTRPDQPKLADSQTLAIGILADPQLDPALGVGPDTWIITAQVYESLVTYTPGGYLLEPRLAESWTGSADGLTWVVKDQPRGKFHEW